MIAECIRGIAAESAEQVLLADEGIDANLPERPADRDDDAMVPVPGRTRKDQPFGALRAASRTAGRDGRSQFLEPRVRIPT